MTSLSGLLNAPQQARSERPALERADALHAMIPAPSAASTLGIAAGWINVPAVMRTGVRPRLDMSFQDFGTRRLIGKSEDARLAAVENDMRLSRAGRSEFAQAGPSPSAHVQHPDHVSRVVVVRDLVRRERISAARKILDSVPADFDGPEIRRLRRMLTPPVVRFSERRDVDRRREFAWLREHASEYKGQWIAIDEHRLVAAAPTLRELRARLRELKLDRVPLLHRL